jgi:surface antigen
MEDFKKSSKMQCFKEGGSVKYKSRHSEKSEMSADVAQDKKVVKKAFAMHDKQEHPGEKTNLSKLKKGGRAKKDCGTVKKFKCGGGVYGAKKTAKDIKNIDDAKDCKPKKLQAGGMTGPASAGLAAAAKSGAMGQGAMSGLESAAMQGALPGGQGLGSINDMERRRMMERGKNAMKYLGPAQQSEFVNQGGMKMKKGGKVKKMNTGGTCS